MMDETTSVQNLDGIALRSDEAHVWLVNPDDITDPTMIHGFFSLMNEAETVQQQRFVREKDRHRYLITRALVRTTLSRYIARDPASWQFVTNTHHRPDIAPEQQHLPPLRFNLTHTNGLIACLVNWEHDAGIDAEEKTRHTGVINIANFAFAPQEIQHLLQTTGEQQKHQFFVYWTLKESYIKARGMGLALPLHLFSFHRSNATSVVVEFADGFGDRSQDWQFLQYHPTDRHILSLAFHRKDRPDYTVRFWKWPLNPVFLGTEGQLG